MIALLYLFLLPFCSCSVTVRVRVHHFEITDWMWQGRDLNCSAISFTEAAQKGSLESDASDGEVILFNLTNTLFCFDRLSSNHNHLLLLNNGPPAEIQADEKFYIKLDFYWTHNKQNGHFKYKRTVNLQSDTVIDSLDEPMSIVQSNASKSINKQIDQLEETKTLELKQNGTSTTTVSTTHASTTRAAVKDPTSTVTWTFARLDRTNCLVEYVVIGVESVILGLIMLIGLFVYLRSRDTCNISLPSFDLRRQRTATVPTQVTKTQNADTWDRTKDYGIHNAAVNNPDIATTSFTKIPVTTPKLTSASRASPDNPHSSANVTLPSKKPRPKEVNTKFKDILKKKNKVALKPPPPPPPKDFNPDYESIEPWQTGGKRREEDIEESDWDEEDDYDDAGGRQPDDTYNDADDRRRR